MTEGDPTKDRLLEAAGEEFAEKGFEGATVRSICARAGANLAAVNYHFGDKEQLYLQAILEAHRCGAEMPEEADCLGGPPAELLRRFIRHFLNHILALNQEGGWRHRLMFRELMRPTEAQETLVREVIRPKFERLLTVLRRVCPDADDRRLTVIAFSVIGQCLHYRVGKPIASRLIGAEAFAALDVDYLTDHIAGFSLAALGMAPPLDAAGEAGPGAPVAGAAGGRRRP
jgi:TetR/AcrR family transcriptional regulator, regulator of cefoperazone and chloramphenicol sensitivity